MKTELELRVREFEDFTRGSEERLAKARDKFNSLKNYLEKRGLSLNVEEERTYRGIPINVSVEFSDQSDSSDVYGLLKGHFKDTGISYGQNSRDPRLTANEIRKLQSQKKLPNARRI